MLLHKEATVATVTSLVQLRCAQPCCLYTVITLALGAYLTYAGLRRAP
jgi:hypothetical protein